MFSELSLLREDIIWRTHITYLWRWDQGALASCSQAISLFRFSFFFSFVFFSIKSCVNFPFLKSVAVQHVPAGFKYIFAASCETEMGHLHLQVAARRTLGKSTTYLSGAK